VSIYAWAIVLALVVLCYATVTTATGLPAKVTGTHRGNLVVGGLDGSLSVKWTLFAPLPPTQQFSVLAQVRCKDGFAIEGDQYVNLTLDELARTGKFGARSRRLQVLTYAVTGMTHYNSVRKSVFLAREQGVKVSDAQLKLLENQLREETRPSYEALLPNLASAYCPDHHPTAVRTVAVVQQVPLSIRSKTGVIWDSDWQSTHIER
jgi:hypothetical protein